MKGTSSSLRLRREKDERKREFIRNRRSGDYGYVTTSKDAVTDIKNCNVISKEQTLDPGPTGEILKHQLREIIRRKYKEHQHTLVEDKSWHASDAQKLSYLLPITR